MHVLPRHTSPSRRRGVAPEVIKALLIKPASRSAYGIGGRLLDRASYGAQSRAAKRESPAAS
jgi:hypothetical protein